MNRRKISPIIRQEGERKGLSDVQVTGIIRDDMKQQQEKRQLYNPVSPADETARSRVFQSDIHIGS